MMSTGIVNGDGEDNVHDHIVDRLRRFAALEGDASGFFGEGVTDVAVDLDVVRLGSVDDVDFFALDAFFDVTFFIGAAVARRAESCFLDFCDLDSLDKIELAWLNPTATLTRAMICGGHAKMRANGAS